MGSARLDNFAGKNQPWVEYRFDNAIDEPLWVWLQVDAIHPAERKIINLDGKELGAITGEQSLADPLGFACLTQPVTLSRGRHTLRLLADNVIGSADAIDAVFLTPQRPPVLERVLRDRAALVQPFKDAFTYHSRAAKVCLPRRRGHSAVACRHRRALPCADPTVYKE